MGQWGMGGGTEGLAELGRLLGIQHKGKLRRQGRHGRAGQARNGARFRDARVVGQYVGLVGW